VKEGDIVRFRPNYGPLSQAGLGTIFKIDRIGNLSIMMGSGRIIEGVFLGNVELISLNHD
jgi:hypothetical protein